MPRQVDPDQRKQQIRAAALSIARRDGLDAITFRAVAAELGAKSTSVVTHYAPTRQALIELTIGELFDLAQSLGETLLPLVAPADGLRLLCEAVVPLTAESKTMASLALQVATESRADAAIADRYFAWGEWLHARVLELVTDLDPPLPPPETTDLLLSAIAGLSMYGLLDEERWPAERLRRALTKQLDLLGLNSET